MGLQKNFADTADAANYGYEFNWLTNLNTAINYIEDNILQQIDYNLVAKIACCSVYHFQRMFSFITGIPISEYIRRRRLTLAAFEIQSNAVKIIDIALKYGYESPESFTRAFKIVHGIKPSCVREKGVTLKAFPKMTLRLSIKGDVEMNYRIEEKDAFDVFGVETDVVNDESSTTVPKFWLECREKGILGKIHEVINLEKDTMLHVATYNCDDEKHTYMICYNAPVEGVPKEFTILSIPKATWAVFSIDSLDIMGNSTVEISSMWKRIFTEWFPTSDYELAPNTPEFEMHFNQGNGKYLCEILIPIMNR